MRRPTPIARQLLALVALAPAWLACADAPTGAAAPQVRDERVSARAEAPLLTLAWQARARTLAAGARLGPLPAVRVFALLGVAQHRALQAADFGGGTAQFEARRGAVAGASAAVLGALFPASASTLAQQAIDDELAGVGGMHPQYARGLEAGAASGALVNAWAAADGFSRPFDGVFPTPGPGIWVPAPGVAPIGYQFPMMTPFYLTEPSQFRPPPPPPFGSPEFMAALAYVRSVTDGRTPEQAAIANKWNVSPASWFVLADQLAVQYGLDEREAARLVALTGMAMHDADIGCFDGKYHYWYIRPRQADPGITLAPGLPGAPYGQPNHPSYPSGHSCLSAAAVTVLVTWFPASAPSLEPLVAEAGMSRIYGGLHYQFDVTAGQELGRDVARWVLAQERAHGLPVALALAATP